MFIVGLFGSFSGMVGISTQLVFCCPEDPHALLSCQITSPLHFPLCMGLIRLLMFHTSLASPPFTELDGRLSPQSTAISPLAGALSPPPSAGHRTQRLRLWTASFPRSRRLSRPAHSATDGGGRRRFGGVTDFCRQPLLFGLALGFVGRP